MSKVLIDRELLCTALKADASIGATAHELVAGWSAMEKLRGALLDTPSGTPAMPVKAYYHEAPNEYGGLNKSVGLEVRKEFADAPLVLEPDAMAQIACLEGEIAKRDARIVGLEGALLDANARLNGPPVSEAKAQDTVGEVVGWYRLDRPYEMTSYPSVCATWHKLGAPVAPLYAAPAAPAADAGLVDMYRHLQTVTPYRFKKIQDASITDGGDVMYFHKDRFDAALLADMAAHSAQGVV